MFFSSLCFTQKTLKTFLSTHKKKIHGIFLFPTERKNPSAVSEFVKKYHYNSVNNCEEGNMFCFTLKKKDFFFFFLSGFFPIVWNQVKKNHSVSLKEKNLVKSFFFHYFTLFQIKNIFFFSQSKKEEKNRVFFSHSYTSRKLKSETFAFIVSQRWKNTACFYICETKWRNVNTERKK